MAVVGPRPLLKEYLPLYNNHQARRHEVRPGFTGYAQVHGRNSITWEDKFDKDVYYVDHISFLEDWKIIFQTIGTVVKREGIGNHLFGIEWFIYEYSVCVKSYGIRTWNSNCYRIVSYGSRSY